MIIFTDRTMRFREVALVAVLGLLTACGGGGGGSSEPAPAATGTSTNDSTNEPQETGRVVTGAASKGPLRNATVAFFAIDEFGFPSATTAIATTTTDANGNFSATLPANTGPLLVVTRGGSFVDESDQQTAPSLKRRITLTTSQSFLSFLPAGRTTVAITPYTHALVLRARQDGSLGGFFSAFTNARSALSEQTGFDVLTTIPADPVSPAADATQAQLQYALLLGTVAQIANTAAIELGQAEPTYTMILGVIRDLADGRLDGSSFGTPVSLTIGDTGRTLPATIDFDAQLNRFRNNNFAAFETVPVPVINTDTLFNETPVANAGEDQIVPQGSTVTLTAAASTDADGTVSGFRWTQESGESVTLTGADTATPTFNAPVTLASGLGLVFSVTVFDNEGRPSPTDTVQVTVTPAFGQESYLVELLPVAHEFGNRVEGGSRILLDQDGTGTLIDNGEFGFTWTESNGVLTMAFNDGGIEESFFDEFNETSGTEVIERFEISLTGTNAAGASEVQVTEFGTITIEGITEPIESADPGAVYSTNEAIPLADPTGRIILPTFIGDAIPTLRSFNDLSDDILTLNGNGTGSAREKGGSLNWTLGADGILTITFANGDSARYLKLDSIEGEGDIIAVDYTLGNGDKRATTRQSFTSTGARYTTANAAGAYRERSEFELQDGTTLAQVLEYRLHPDGSGVFEIALEGADTSGSASAVLFNGAIDGICWSVNNQGRLIISQTPFATDFFYPGSLISTPSFCSSLTDTDVFLRESRELFERGSAVDLTHVERFFNFSGETFDLEQISAAVYERSPLVSTPAVAVPDSVDVELPVDFVPVPVLQNDQPGDSPIDVSSVQIIGQPQFGTVTVNRNNGVVRYTPTTLSETNPFDQFSYRVLDADGNTSSLGVVDVNLLGIANAGPDITVPSSVENGVQLDGSASDGNTFTWTQIQGDPVSLQDANTATPVFFPLPALAQPGFYEFELQVTDSSGNTGFDTVAVNVTPAFDAVGYTVRQLSVPFQFGNDLAGAAKLEFFTDGTGLYTDASTQSPFDWFESFGFLTVDFAGIGGHTVSTFVDFPDIDNDGFQEEVETVATLDSLEISLIAEGGNIDEISVRELGEINQTILDDPLPAATPPGTTLVDETHFDYKLFAAGAEIPFSFSAPHERSLLVDLLPAFPTLFDTNGIYPDKLMFGSGGSGTTDRKGDTFTWSIDANGNLDVNFTGGDTAKYRRFEMRPSGEVVFAEYNVGGVDARAAASLSESDDGSEFNAMDVPGIYRTEGSFELNNGARVPVTSEYRLHPGGVGVLEIPQTDPVTGVQTPFRSSFGICWSVVGGQLIMNRAFTGTAEPAFDGGVPSPTFCSGLAEGDINFRRTNELYVTDGSTRKTLVLDELNNGTALDVISVFPRIFDVEPFFGDQPPPVLIDTNASVSGGSGIVLSAAAISDGTIVSNPGETLTPPTVQVIHEVNGTTMVNFSTGEIVFTPTVTGPATGFVYYRVQDIDTNLSTIGIITIDIL